jgi:hypothetical protein
MASQAAQFDLTTAFLDLPATIGYGLVRGSGNVALSQQLTDNSRVAFYILGEGPWDSILRLWINENPVDPSDLSQVHFHPGIDGEPGNGLSPVSTGGDQHVDSFFTLLPSGLSPVTFSRYVWMALHVPPDIGAPTAGLTVLADYQAMKVRQFDSSGNQTAFAWTQNWAWIICDFLLRKFVLREAKVNQPLVPAELARFDWQSFSDSAAYYDAALSLGQPRFSDGGVVLLNNTDTAANALEQMLMMCRSYILDRNGKFSLYADKPRSSVFTFASGNVKPLSFKAYKSNLRTATNRLSPTYRDYSLASGSADDATRFAITSNPLMNHYAHQRAIGARGPGLSPMPKVTEMALDLGVNTPERVWRILKGMVVRQLGNDVDENTPYAAPFSMQLTGFEDSLGVEPGDLVTVDPSISEEFGGKIFEVLEIDENPDGSRDVIGLEYMPDSFPDVAPPQQALQAPNPGQGIDGDLALLAARPAGFQINPNGSFLGGLAGYSVYDSNATGNVTISLVSDSTAPSSSGFVMRIATASGSPPAPGLGGFYLGFDADAGIPRPAKYHRGDRIMWRVLAKIPAGYSLEWASNAFGTGGTIAWLSDQAGTGAWKWYLLQQTIGVSGTFSTTGFFYLDGGAAPVSWDVADVDAIDTDQALMIGSGEANYGVNSNYTNDATVDSVDLGSNDTIRIYGPGGIGSSWHFYRGGTSLTMAAGSISSRAYNTTYWVYWDGSSFQSSTSAFSSLPDGYIFVGKITTVLSGGGGGTPGGGGGTGGGGGHFS